MSDQSKKPRTVYISQPNLNRIFCGEGYSQGVTVWEKKPTMESFEFREVTPEDTDAERRGFRRAIEMLRGEHNKIINGHTVQLNWGADLAADWLEERWNP